MELYLFSFAIWTSILGTHSYTFEGYSCLASGVPNFLGVNTPSSYTAGVNAAETGSLSIGVSHTHVDDSNNLNDIEDSGDLESRLYDKRDDFDSPIVNCQFLRSNIPSSPAYGRLYFVEDSQYLSQCCGIITSWEFHASATGTLELLVWRRVAGTEWMVSGKNRIDVKATGSQTYDPSTSTVGDYRLSVKPGDYIGWYSLGNDIISYASSTSKLTRVRPTVTSVSVGDITDWSQYTVDSIDRDYAIKAKIETESGPTLTSMGTITMLDSSEAGSVIHTVLYSHTDRNDDLYISVQSQSSAFFNFDTTTYEISLGYSYIPEGSYTMTFLIQDQCGNTDTETVTISVTNVPLTIDNVPTGTSATIDEGMTTQTTLHSIVTSDSSVADCTYCVLSNNDVGPFVVEQNNVSVQTFDINVQDRPQFDYETTPEYLLVIECDDGSYTATSTFTVNIRKNQVPYFTNTVWSTEIDAEALGIGSLIFTVTSSDNEGNDMYYAMTCDPSGCPFVMLDSGKIVTNAILIHHSVAEYTLTVTVSDSRQTSDGSTIAVKINNINSKPVLNNVPTALSVAENTALGSTLFTFTAADNDADDTLLMSIYYSDGIAASLFTFYPDTGVLTTSSWNAIDYEELSTRTFTATISVGDGKFYQQNTFTITVENENEAPMFLQKYYATYQLEGASQTTLPLPLYNYREPDGDTVTFTVDCGADSGRFIMDGSNGEVRYNQEYDLDTSNIPTEVICTLRITDPGGLFDTAELAINIDHDNEFDPQFTSLNFHFYVDSREFIGEIIGQVYASESDGSDTDHGKFYYTLDQSAQSKEYFGIMDDGQIYVKESLSDLYLGQLLVLSVTATDYSGRTMTIPVNVEVPAFITNPPEYVDEPRRTYITSPENMPLFIGALAIACVIGVMVAWLLAQYATCPGLPIQCRKQTGSLLEEEQPLSDDPKIVKKNQDKKILDEMFGIDTTKTNVKSSTDF